MSHEYETRFYQTGDEIQIVPLLEVAFKKWPFFDLDCSPIDHWRWKYLDNPDCNTLVVVILSDNKIIAFCSNLLYIVIIKGKKYLGSYATDTCVHPSHQGKGLYKVLIDKIVAKKKDIGVEFGYMVTVNPKVINSKTQRKATPHSFPYRIKYMSHIDNLDLHREATSQGIWWKIGKIIGNVRSSPIGQPDPSIQINTLTNFDETITGFLEKTHYSYDFMKIRTVDNLNWRYLDPRAGSYHVRAVYENGEVTGYGVFRINRQEAYLRGFVVDLLALPDKIHHAEALLLDGLNYFRENMVNNVLFQVVENHPYERLVSKYGFSGGQGNRYFFYNNYGYDKGRLENVLPEKTHFVFGDLTGI